MRTFRRDDMDLEPSPPDPIRNELVRELVDKLPPDQQLVVSLYYFGGTQPTINQIAEETHMSISKVKGLLARANVNLRNMLEAHGVGSVPTGD